MSREPRCAFGRVLTPLELLEDLLTDELRAGALARANAQRSGMLTGDDDPPSIDPVFREHLQRHITGAKLAQCHFGDTLEIVFSHCDDGMSPQPQP
jgi:hypothetical protein